MPLKLSVNQNALGNEKIDQSNLGQKFSLTLGEGLEKKLRPIKSLKWKGNKISANQILDQKNFLPRGGLIFKPHIYLFLHLGKTPLFCYTVKIKNIIIKCMSDSSYNLCLSRTR